MRALDGDNGVNPCELEIPRHRRARNAEFAGGRVLKGSHRLLPVGAPLGRIIMLQMLNSITGSNFT
jgi:hypothetical protein